MSALGVTLTLVPLCVPSGARLTLVVLLTVQLIVALPPAVTHAGLALKFSMTGADPEGVLDPPPPPPQLPGSPAVTINARIRTTRSLVWPRYTPLNALRSPRETGNKELALLLTIA